MEKLSVTRSEVLAVEIMKCQKLLAKLWADDSRTAVLSRRRSLFRLLHNVPQALQIGPDWLPEEPHPVWQHFPNSTNPFNPYKANA